MKEYDQPVTPALAIDELILVGEEHIPADIAHVLIRTGVDMSVSDGATHLYSPEQRFMLVNKLQGYLGEDQVAAAINSGHVAGVSHYVPAPTANQAAWDGTATVNGHAGTHIQIKWSEHDTIIANHLAAHPDIPVVTNHEAALVAAKHGHTVIDSGLAYDDARVPVNHVVDSHRLVLHLVHEWIPLISIAVIASGAGWQVYKGADAKAATRTAVRRSATVSTINVVSTGVAMVSGVAVMHLVVAVGISAALGRNAQTRQIVATAERCGASYDAQHAAMQTVCDETRIRIQQLDELLAKYTKEI